MEKVKDFIKNNKKIVIPLAILVVILVVAGIYFATAGTNDKKEPASSQTEKETTSSQTEKEAEEQEVKLEDIEPLEEKGIITGIKDMKVKKGTKVNLEDLAVANKDYVKSIVVDDSKVDYNKEGEYEVIYTITFDGEKLQEFLKDENIKVTFDTESSTSIIKVTITVTVIDEETAKEEEEKGSEIITNETKDKIAEENKTESTSNGNTNATTGSSLTGNNSGNSGSNAGSGSSKPAHQHTWVDHTATRQVWVENWVDVPDYETRTISGARFYTQNGDGTMTANGPTYWFENGFTQEDLKAIIHNALKNGDNGVLNGVYYGNYQNVTKTEQVQVGSHKEDHGSYQTQSYVDYQYCSVCGITR